MKAVVLLAFALLLTHPSFAQRAWQADLDSRVRFYQTTDLGVILAGTERSLYALDSQTGSRMWRIETGAVGETAVTPVPNTDMVLLSRDLGSKSRLEAVDIMSGDVLWQSNKVKGDVMQLAADPENDLVAVVLAKDARGGSDSGLKRKPIVHVLRMSSGEELWKRELDGEIEMMPARFGEDGDVAFTLDNYRAPLIIDGRLFLFYEGSTSYDAETGKEKEREKFKINENGLALTEADPIVDDTHVFTSGRGKIRAVSRRTGQVDWRSEDLGTTAEMALVGNMLFIRTGGRFTRLKNGETESKGPYGIAAIDPSSGKTIWRYKGADKGITNFVFRTADSILVADRDDVVYLDAVSGKRTMQYPHKISNAEFVLINESDAVVVGGRDEIAAFADSFPSRSERLRSKQSDYSARELWRVRHKAPARGALRVVAGIALRATALYFRYGGLASSAFGIARNGLNLASTVNSFRWSGLRSRFGSLDLTTLASSYAGNYAESRIYTYGSLSRISNAAQRIAGLQLPRVRANLLGRVAPSGGNVREGVLDRLDPTRQLDRLSDYLLRRKRVSGLRGGYMYFYTDIPKPFDRKGLIGVNLQNGEDLRYVLASDPDRQFTIDETLDLFYSSNASRLEAFDILKR